MRDRVSVLVLAPTRELATQIQEEADRCEGQMFRKRFTVVSPPRWGSAAGHLSACAYGGAPKRDQLKAMERASVIVATPGRLNDFLDSRQVQTPLFSIVLSLDLF